MDTRIEKNQMWQKLGGQQDLKRHVGLSLHSLFRSNYRAILLPSTITSQVHIYSKDVLTLSTRVRTSLISYFRGFYFKPHCFSLILCPLLCLHFRSYLSNSDCIFYPSLNILYLAEFLTHSGLTEYENQCIEMR